MDQTVPNMGTLDMQTVSYKHWFKGLLWKLAGLKIDLRRRGGGVLIAIDNVFMK